MHSSTSGHWFQADPLCFKRAVFYEIHLRGFYDGNGDGSGDLRWLTEKLDYLKWLGIDCIWLPPFYDSPLRDGGYDIRDFYKVLPEFGTVDDFVALMQPYGIAEIARSGVVSMERSKKTAGPAP